MSDDDPARSMGRRTLLTALGTTGAVLGLGGTGLSVADTGGLSTAGGQSGGSWSQFMHDAANTGHNPQASGPTRDVTARWADTTAEETQGLVVANETVYVGGSRVGALAASDGSKRWTHDPNGTTFANPTVAAKTVFVSADRGDGEQNAVVGLAADSGEVRWEYTDEDADSARDYDAITAGPAALFVVAGTGFDDWLYAIEIESGTKLWATSIGPPGQVETGTAAVAVVDGTVYVPGAQELHARDAETGEVVWRAEETDFYNEPSANPAVADGTVYVGAGAADQGGQDRFFALDAGDGTVEWRFDPDDEDDGFWSGPAVAGTRVYVTRQLGGNVVLYALNAADGSVEWSVPVTHAMYPSVADGVVYGGDVAFDAETGETLWHTDRDVVLPAAVDRTVYAVGNGVAALVESTDGGEGTPTEQPETPTENGTPTETSTPTETDAGPAGDTATETDTTTQQSPGQTATTATETAPVAPDATDSATAGNQPARTDGTTDTDAGAPGLGILGTLGGVASVAGYYLYTDTNEPEE